MLFSWVELHLALQHFNFSGMNWKYLILNVVFSILFLWYFFCRARHFLYCTDVYLF